MTSRSIFSGLSAFPLTPLAGDGPDFDSFAVLVAGLADSGVDSIGALGSTGGYAYLRHSERRDLARVAVQAAGETPVLVGVGDHATRDVLGHVENAQNAGAAGVLLSPVSYQPLLPDEVFALFEAVTTSSDLPVVVYDNPSTTGFTFTTELHARIAALPGVVSIKLPAVAEDPGQAREDVSRLRSAVPDPVTLGVSGDEAGARGLLAGCDAWYSVVAGVFPRVSLEITRAAQAGDADRAYAASARLQPIWDLFSRFGSYRTVSAIAAEIGLVTPEGLRHPVLPLSGDDRDAVRLALRSVGTLD